MGIQKGIYEHYKGKRYEVIDVARHSETREEVVVYKTLYKGDYPEGSLWVRPLAMFMETVTVDGRSVPRFRRVESALPEPANEKKGLNPIMAVYYFGALTIMLSFSYFLSKQWDYLTPGSILIISLAFQLLLAKIGHHLRTKLGYPISGGLLITAAVSITPLTVYALQKLFGFSPATPKHYSDYWTVVRPCWVVMELATLAVAILAVWRVRFAFLALVIGHTAWFLSMDVVELILGPGQQYSKPYIETRQWVSLLVGGGMIAIARLLDRRSEEDYSLWLYIYGALVLVGASMMIWMDHGELAIYAVPLYAVLFVASIRWQRRSLIVFGGIGIYAYLGHLAWDIFKDSPVFPLVLAFIGLLMVLGAVAFQMNQKKLFNVTNK